MPKNLISALIKFKVTNKQNVELVIRRGIL